MDKAGTRPFVYMAKACEFMTYVKRFCRTKTLMKDFGLITDLLGKQIG